MLEILLSLVLSQQLIPVTFDATDLANNEPTTSITIPVERPALNASAALVYDINRNQILYQANSNTQLPIASITKLILALIIIDENRLDEIVTVPVEATRVEPVKSNFIAGEQLTVESLLHAALIKSSNDAAYTLAIHNAGSIPAFVTKMNEYAAKLDMTNSHFANPAGFDDPNNYSTASDLLKLSREVIKSPTILNIVRKESFTITNIENTIKHELTSTNQLLGSEFHLIGLKTGTTPIAGQCFLGLTEGNQPLITILLHSSNRFQETKMLIDWAETNYPLTTTNQNL